MTTKALAAELIGTFMITCVTIGAWLFAAPAGGGLTAVALGAGLAYLVMAYSLGHISGGHFNPAVTIGLIAGGRFEPGHAVGYIVAQLVGAVGAALLCQVILSGAVSAGPGATTRWNTFTSIANTYGGTNGFSLLAASVTEVVATALLLVVVMGATASRASAGFAPLAIGLGLALLYLVALPVTNASLNPARSTAVAVVAGGLALSQLWLFWVAPLVGAVLGGALGRWLDDEG